MIKNLFNTIMLLSTGAILFTACSKKDDILSPQPLPQPQPGAGLLSVRLKAAITVGNVLYDSIPANFTITSWDVNNIALQKDTVLNPGVQVI